MSEPPILIRTPTSDQRSPARDLEDIVTYIDLAACSLMTEVSSTFTVDELIDEVGRFTAGSIEIDSRDIRIVAATYSALQKLPGGRLRLK